MMIGRAGRIENSISFLNKVEPQRTRSRRKETQSSVSCILKEDFSSLISEKAEYYVNLNNENRNKGSSTECVAGSSTGGTSGKKIYSILTF